MKTGSKRCSNRLNVMKKKIPLRHRPWFEFLSSMRFAVALLTLLAIASMIGTVLQQNQPMTDYVVKFGPFWFPIFKTLGLFDVYAAPWFVVILLFLVVSISLCVWRHTPAFLRQMRSFRLNASAKSLAAMKHTVLLEGELPVAVLQRYWQVQGFQVKTQAHADGSVMVAAKKGSASKLGYIFAHVAIVVICIGGLIDSNMDLNWGRLLGNIVPDNQTILAKDFAPEARLDAKTLSFRGNVTIAEGQATDVVFLNAGDGLVVQDLPFVVQLERFHVDFYETGMPKNFASDLLITDKQSGQTEQATIKVNQPFIQDGVAIFQSSFGDGGSDLVLQAWDVRRPWANSASVQAKSLQNLPLVLDNQDYQIELEQLRVLNVEDANDTPASVLKPVMHDVRNVNSAQTLHNVGPTITYKVRNTTGVAHEYLSYMLPLTREGERYFVIGERASVAEDYRWVKLPADQEGELKTVMWLRQGFANPAVRDKAVAAALQDMDTATAARLKPVVEQVLHLFSQGGYVALNGFVATNFTATEQPHMQKLFTDILQISSVVVLNEVLQANGEAAWQDTPERAHFMAMALEGLTDFSQMQAPIYLQLTDFKQVQASGLQMAKSPGRYWVYLGSLLLILGTVCMFYVREKRVWVWIAKGSMRVAMSANKDSGTEIQLAEHVQRLQKLQQDLSS